MQIQASDLDNERGTLALERLSQGLDVLLIPPISIVNAKCQGLQLLVWSKNGAESTSMESAKLELLHGKGVFEELLSNWPELEKLISGAELPCYLHHDYGMGSIRLAQLKPNGEVAWLHPDQPEST